MRGGIQFFQLLIGYETIKFNIISQSQLFSQCLPRICHGAIAHEVKLDWYLFRD